MRLPMITVEEFNNYLKNHTVISSSRAVLKNYPFHEGTVFKINGVEDNLFISDKANGLYFHSALTLLKANHPYKHRCYYVYDSEVIPINIGLKV